MVFNLTLQLDHFSALPAIDLKLIVAKLNSSSLKFREKFEVFFQLMYFLFGGWVCVYCTCIT